MPNSKSCGTFVIDPFDIDIDCCIHVEEPVRPHQVVRASLTLKNLEQSRVTGEVDYQLRDARSGEKLTELEDYTVEFDLEPDEEVSLRLEFNPEDVGVDHTRISREDDDMVVQIEYALRNVRAPDEEGESANI